MPRLEDKMRRIEIFFVENRLSKSLQYVLRDVSSKENNGSGDRERSFVIFDPLLKRSWICWLSHKLRMLQPDLRTELSRGLDAKKRTQDQDQSLLVNRWNGGGYSLSFGSLVDAIECNDDQACRAAEWFRYEQQLKDSIDTNEHFAEIIGESPLDQRKKEMERLENLSGEALEKIESESIPPAPMDVDDYVGHVTALATALNARRDALMSHAADVISAKRWEFVRRQLLFPLGISNCRPSGS
jgi:hypothetical protein